MLLPATQADEFYGAAKALMEANGRLIESEKLGDLDAFSQPSRRWRRLASDVTNSGLRRVASFVIRGDLQR